MKIKYYFQVFLLAGILLGQNSSLALSGLGERVRGFDPAAAGIGNSQYFSGRANGVSLTALSSLWMSPLSRIYVSTSFGFVDSRDLPAQQNQYFRNLSFIFPVGKQKAMTIGLKPATRADFYIHETLGSNPNVQFGDQYFTSITNYHAVGGLSGLYAGYASKIGENLSLGAQWTWSFGNLFQYDTLLTYSVTTDPLSGDVVYGNFASNVSTLQRTHRFHGQTLALEGRFRAKKNEFVFSAMMQPHLTVTTNHRYGSIGDAPEEKYTSGLSLRSLGFGYSRVLGSTQGLTVEFHRIENENIPSSTAIFKTLSGTSNSLNLGYYKVFNNPRLSYWNTLNTRGGVYFIQLNKPAGTYYDLGITLGIGIDYIKSKNAVDLALIFGQRSSEFEEFTGEKYVSLVLGFTAGEMWFMKRKRK
ncbi:MAG: hypothetical protein GXO91_10835 [FCB group bacterium]|nr:hypothetical protein [FCB group bacterium]